MNVLRAEDISRSPEMKNVTYNGTPVYVQHVDRRTQSVRVSPLADPQHEFEVQADQLQEHE